MGSALLFALFVTSSGFAILRVLGLAKGALAIGLAPAVGLAALAVTSSWLVLLGVHPPLAGAAVVLIGAVGLFLAARDRAETLDAVRVFGREQWVALVALVVALIVPVLAMGIAFSGTAVPLSPHDGAAHTEAIQAYRLGQAWSSWYPPGLAAVFAAALQAMPWVDSAAGAFELGMSLPPLAALAVFGLGVAVFRDMRVAAAGALLLSFTYLYPYFPQIWSGWPLAMSLILVMGVWTVALEYLDRPSVRWGVLAGLGIGATVLVHGSELYTLLIVLPLALIGRPRRVVWRDLGWALCVTVLVAALSAAAYLPSLVRWAGSGGAYAAALKDAPSLTADANPGVTLSPGPSLFMTFALTSLGIDMPIRVALLAIGIVWAFRARVGRTLVSVGLVFAGLATLLTQFGRVPLLREIYALTFPWGMHYRLLMLVTISVVLLAGAGGVWLVCGVERFTRRPGVWFRRLRRTERLLVVTWALLATFGTVVYLAYPARVVLGYDASDDGAAMAWLRAHASPSDVVVNDGYADAGIWAPYKAGVTVLLPRWTTLSQQELARRWLVVANIERLDQVPEAAAAACAEHVRWVYYGARTSAWDKRRFPPLAELEASPALEEVFRHGGAVIFRQRGLSCP